MNRNTTLLVGLALATGALGACSKPASETASTADAAASNAAADASNATAAAAGGVTEPGGAVSPPSSPQNDAVNSDTNKADPTQTPGSTSFTEDQARGHIENAGYSDVTGLTKSSDGMWTGSAKKGGKTVQVSLDFKGAVSAK